MDSLRIEGGVPLKGEIVVSGAKNAALPLIAAGLVTDGTLRLRNVPDLSIQDRWRSFFAIMAWMSGERATCW